MANTTNKVRLITLASQSHVNKSRITNLFLNQQVKASFFPMYTDMTLRTHCSKLCAV